MSTNGKAGRITVVALVLIISALHYSLRPSLHHMHIFFRELYFVPIVLAAFLFGLRGAVMTSTSITVLYAPFVVMSWKGFSPDDFDTVMEILFYNVMAIALGLLRNREMDKQRRLRDMESLAAMGKALSAVAHDMKGPLMAIHGFTELVQRALKPDEPSHQKLGIVLQQARRLDHLTRDMLDFAKPLYLCVSKEDLNALILESLLLAEGEAKNRRVGIERKLEEGLSSIDIDGMRMGRVLYNLLTNAIQASPEGEVVAVSTWKNCRHIGIDIVDHGSGIDVAQRDQIFAPFFTTKKEGTGLGLPIAKKIIEAHGGQLQVLDNSDRGTTFRILLPQDGCGE